MFGFWFETASLNAWIPTFSPHQTSRHFTKKYYKRPVAESEGWVEEESANRKKKYFQYGLQINTSLDLSEQNEVIPCFLYHHVSIAFRKFTSQVTVYVLW